MAGEWLKMRLDLAEDPAVIAMAASLDVDEDLIVGKLHRLWSWADRQSRDGHATGVTGKWIDRFIRLEGFAAAMSQVGWLRIDPSGISFPNFDRHNGETAKTRALGTKRKQKQRSDGHGPVTPASRPERDGSVTREEKRREEAIELPTHAERTIGSAERDEARAGGEAGSEEHPPSLAAAADTIRAAGCPDVAATNAHLVASLHDGITVPELSDLAKLHPGKGIAYLCKKARGVRADAAANAGVPPAATGSTRNVEGPSPRKSPEREAADRVEALAAQERQFLELGLAAH